MTWKIDLAHTGVTVSAKHMMLTTVRGRMKVAEGSIDFDEANPERSRIDVKIDAASIDTGQEQRDAHLRSPDFLDVEQYPYITFHSTGVERRGDDYRLLGELTIRGVSRPVTLDTEFLGIQRDWKGGGRRAAFTATTRISREDWGLTWNVALEQGGWLVSKDLKIEIELAAVEPANEQRETRAA